MIEGYDEIQKEMRHCHSTSVPHGKIDNMTLLYYIDKFSFEKINTALRNGANNDRETLCFLYGVVSLRNKLYEFFFGDEDESNDGVKDD